MENENNKQTANDEIVNLIKDTMLHGKLNRFSMEGLESREEIHDVFISAASDPTSDAPTVITITPHISVDRYELLTACDSVADGHYNSKFVLVYSEMRAEFLDMCRAHQLFCKKIRKVSPGITEYAIYAYRASELIDPRFGSEIFKDPKKANKLKEMAYDWIVLGNQPLSTCNSKLLAAARALGYELEWLTCDDNGRPIYDKETENLSDEDDTEEEN